MKTYGVAVCTVSQWEEVQAVIENLLARNAKLEKVATEARRACAMYRRAGDSDIVAIRIVCMGKALAALDEEDEV